MKPNMMDKILKESIESGLNYVNEETQLSDVLGDFVDTSVTIKENSVSRNLPTAYDSFLQDVAQITGSISYNDIQKFDPKAVNRLKGLKDDWEELDPLDDEDEVEAIGKAVAKIVKSFTLNESISKRINEKQSYNPAMLMIGQPIKLTVTDAEGKKFIKDAEVGEIIAGGDIQVIDNLGYLITLGYDGNYIGDGLHYHQVDEDGGLTYDLYTDLNGNQNDIDALQNM